MASEIIVRKGFADRVRVVVGILPISKSGLISPGPLTCSSWMH